MGKPCASAPLGSFANHDLAHEVHGATSKVYPLPLPSLKYFELVLRASSAIAEATTSATQASQAAEFGNLADEYCICKTLKPAISAGPGPSLGCVQIKSSTIAPVLLHLDPHLVVCPLAPFEADPKQSHWFPKPAGWFRRAFWWHSGSGGWRWPSEGAQRCAIVAFNCHGGNYRLMYLLSFPLEIHHTAAKYGGCDGNRHAKTSSQNVWRALQKGISLTQHSWCQ